MFEAPGGGAPWSHLSRSSGADYSRQQVLLAVVDETILGPPLGESGPVPLKRWNIERKGILHGICLPECSKWRGRIRARRRAYSVAVIGLGTLTRCPESPLLKEAVHITSYFACDRHGLCQVGHGHLEWLELCGTLPHIGFVDVAG